MVNKSILRHNGHSSLKMYFKAKRVFGHFHLSAQWHLVSRYQRVISPLVCRIRAFYNQQNISPAHADILLGVRFVYSTFAPSSRSRFLSVLGCTDCNQTRFVLTPFFAQYSIGSYIRCSYLSAPK